MNNGRKKASKKKPVKRTSTPKKAVTPTVPFKQIIPYVQNQMASDDDGNDKQSCIIQNHYQNADEATKKVIDDIFAALCGWSMQTIIESADPIGEEEFDDGGYKYQDNDGHEEDSSTRE